MSNQALQKPSAAREYWYDNMKSFLILSVVVGHLISGRFGAENIEWLYSLKNLIAVYHMPVFFMISGRFSGTRINKNEWDKVFSKVLVPYLTAEIALLLLCSALGDSTVSNFYFPRALYGLWYLFNIVVYLFLTPILKRCKWLLPLSFLAALLAGFAPAILPAGIHRLVCYYPFFLFGYYTRSIDYSFMKKPVMRILSVLLFAVIAVYVFTHYDVINYNLLSINKTYEAVSEVNGKPIAVTVLYLISRYIIAFVFFFIVAGISPAKENIFTRFGSYSVYIYVLHLIIILAFRYVASEHSLLLHIDSNFKLVLFLLTSIPLCFILVSKPVRKATRFFIEPRFDIVKIINKLTEE